MFKKIKFSYKGRLLLRNTGKLTEKVEENH